MNQKYGIIDVGSNSLRLVIYEKQGENGYKEIENVKVVARLRKYMNKDKIVSDKGIDVLLEALLDFQEITRLHQVDNMMCAATATIRQAKNQQEICDIIKSKTDFTIEIISEYREAYYGYEAVVHSTPIVDGITVDMGGGSTEVTYVKNRRMIYYHSFPFGALSLKQQFVIGDIPTDGERKKVAEYVREQFSTLDWLQDAKLPIIAIGGSARSMVRTHKMMTAYPISGEHLYEMNHHHIEEVQKMLTSLSYEELQKFDGIARDRADTIIPAVQVFIELADIVKMTSLFLSRKGLRDGLLYKYFLRLNEGVQNAMEVKNVSIRRVANEYQLVDSSFDEKLQEAVHICQQLKKLGIIAFTDEDYNFLSYGITLYNIGRYIDFESSEQHSFYFIANKTIDGFLHKERVALALLASYQSKGKFKEYFTPFSEWFTKEERQKLQIVGSLIKLINGLHITTRSIVEDIELVIEKNNILFIVTCKGSYLMEEEQVQKQKKHLERALKKDIQFRFVQ